MLKNKVSHGFLVLGIVLSLFLFCSFVSADKGSEITITVPAELMGRMISQTLPVEVNKKKDISGAIWIESIDKLKLGHNKISFFMKMRGEDIAYTARIGETPVVLNLGNVSLALNCDAKLRYDRQRNVLYVKPEIISEKTGSESFSLLLNGLLGDEEIPLEIQKIRPFIAKLGNDTLTVNMNISNIYTMAEVLCIGIEPSVLKNRDAPFESRERK